MKDLIAKIEACRDHTPGPWQAEQPFREGYVQIIGGLDCDANDDGTPRMISTHVADVMDNNDEQANAGLIALAPEMAAALQWLPIERLTNMGGLIIATDGKARWIAREQRSSLPLTWQGIGGFEAATATYFFRVPDFALAKPSTSIEGDAIKSRSVSEGKS